MRTHFRVSTASVLVLCCLSEQSFAQIKVLGTPIAEAEVGVTIKVDPLALDTLRKLPEQMKEVLASTLKLSQAMFEKDLSMIDASVTSHLLEAQCTGVGIENDTNDFLKKLPAELLNRKDFSGLYTNFQDYANTQISTFTYTTSAGDFGNRYGNIVHQAAIVGCASKIESFEGGRQKMRDEESKYQSRANLWWRLSKGECSKISDCLPKLRRATWDRITESDEKDIENSQAKIEMAKFDKEVQMPPLKAPVRLDVGQFELEIGRLFEIQDSIAVAKAARLIKRATESDLEAGGKLQRVAHALDLDRRRLPPNPPEDVSALLNNVRSDFQGVCSDLNDATHAYLPIASLSHKYFVNQFARRTKDYSDQAGAAAKQVLFKGADSLEECTL